VELDDVPVGERMLASDLLTIKTRAAPHPGIAERVRDIFVDEPRHALDGFTAP
jgi:hypothetical protein